MKKITSFLLALVMVFSMLPGTAMPVAAAETISTQNHYYNNVIVHETFDDINTGITKGQNGKSTDEQYTVQATGAAHIKTGTMTETGVCDAVTAGLDLLTTTFDVNRGFEVSFVADFNDLVIAKPNTSSSATSGLIVDVRAAVRCRYSFFADAEGNVYVSQYDQGQVAYFDTGADLGDKQVDVRIVVDDDMRGTVVVNGQYVARFRTSQGAPTSNYHFLLYTGTANRVDDSRVNDVVLYDLKLAQGAEDTAVMQAYYTYEAPYLDGKFDEINWPFESGNRVVMLSDEEYLYIAVNNTDADPDFVINGVKLTANPKTGAVTLSNGKWAGDIAKNGSQSEIRIALKSALGLDFAPGQKLAFDYPWGTNGFTGTVVLADRAMVSYEAFDAKKTGLGSAASEVYAVQEGDGKILLKTGTYSAGGVQDLHHKDIDASKMAIDKGFDFEFTADFTDLIVPVVPGTKQEWSWSKMQYVTVATNPSSPFYWYDAGFGIELRAEPCRYYGFHADANGNIYVTQRMSDYTQVTRVDTGVDVGATNVHVRLSAADNGVTTIYINGEPLAETLPAPTWACPLTGGLGYYRFHNSTRNRDTSSNRVNDVTLYNLVVTQDAPAPEVKERPLSTKTNVDMTAYLNLDGIKLDGVPGEAQWYTPYVVAGTGHVPGGTVGMSWGDSNLYIGGDTKADTVALTIGGKQLTANFSVASNDYATSNTGFEWTIPLSKVNLSGVVLGKSVPYEIKLTNANGTSSLKGTLTFSGEQMLFGDTGYNYAEKDYLLGNGDGHLHWDRTGDGQWLYARGLDAKKDDGSLYAAGAMCGHQRFIPVDYANGAFNLELTTTINSLPYIVGDQDVMGMYGVTFQLVGENMRAIFALCSDGEGNVVVIMRHSLETETFNTGVKIGADEPVTFRFEVDKKQSMSLYIDGAFKHAFAPIDRTDTTATNIKLSEPCLMYGMNHGYRQPNQGDAGNSVDVVIHDLHLTKTPYSDSNAVVQAALEQLTEASILNGGDADNVTGLVLPSVLYVDGIGEMVSVSWSATDKLTGRTAYGVDLTTGVVTALADTQAFDLKAEVKYGETSATKTFTFQTRGSAAAGNVALIENDDAPASGIATDWDSSRYVYLDDTHNSVVINRGAKTPFNRIVLRDSDEYSRVNARHLGVFISDDGKTWTKVTGWMLHQDGRTYTLYNLNAAAQYVKVHCYHDDLDLVEKPTFYNKLSEMLVVSNEKTLPGARGKFAYNAAFKATNATEEEKKDTPVFVSLTALGAAAGQYKKGCPDFRFTIGDTTLAHWYNGKDGFYVRVPAIPAKGSVEITAHWGCNSARDFSDGEAVFEVTYGNVSLINLSRETYEGSGGNLEQSILSHGRPFTFPNGDIIVVGRTMKAASNAGVFRSTDGGHTFTFDNMAFLDGDYVRSTKVNGADYRSSGFGGYMWDDSIKTEKNGVKYEGRLYLITYSGQGGDASDYRLVLQYSDDYAHTWSEPVFLSLPGAADVINKNTKLSAVSTLQNAQARIGAPNKADNGDPNVIKAGEMATRAQIVCDGLVLRDADGDGPNVDYVIHHGEMIYDYTLDANGNRVATNPDKNKRNVATAIYSSDGGQTWYCSDTLICIPGVLPIRHMEDGLSEGSIAQLDNGDLYVVIRAQEEGNYYQYKAVSKDFGKTWIETDYDNVLSSNTSPVLVEYGTDRLQMWSACTGLGEVSYRRTPMHLGLSIDNYETFDKIIDLTFSTAFDSVRALQGRKSQPGIAISADGKSAFVCYHDQHWHYNEGAWKVDAGKFLEKGGTMGFAIEEFDQMVYGTKGAWDDFEDSSLKYQGWLTDVDSTIQLSHEQAVSGKQSMKLLDESASSPATALRQIPSMKFGTVGAKIMVPKTNEAEFVMELKAGYNYTHMQFAIAAIFVTPNGSVGYVDADKNQHVLTNVVAGSWNDYALSFDVATEKGTLYVNGTNVGTFDLPELEKDVDLVHGATVVQFNQAAATRANRDCLYVDDFYAHELVAMTRTVEEPEVEQTLLGRFMTIVRQIIEVNGETVELVEWGWVPGL